jgi:hypothetical protein
MGDLGVVEECESRRGVSQILMIIHSDLFI